MPIRSGAMQRPSGCRCGNTLRQRYDEVGLPCSSTMGSPSPTSTYAIWLPRTRRRCFLYGKAAEIMLASPSFFVVAAAEDLTTPLPRLRSRRPDRGYDRAEKRIRRIRPETEAMSDPSQGYADRFRDPDQRDGSASPTTQSPRGQRLCRAIELIVGASAGVGIRVLLISAGPWQISVVVALGASVAVLVDGKAVINVQAYGVATATP